MNANKKKADKQKKADKPLIKEGYLWKKKSKGLFGGWNKRYVLLENDKILFYDNE
jgi:hypothetical protein